MRGFQGENSPLEAGDAQRSRATQHTRVRCTTSDSKARGAILTPFHCGNAFPTGHREASTGKADSREAEPQTNPSATPAQGSHCVRAYSQSEHLTSDWQTLAGPLRGKFAFPAFAARGPVAGRGFVGWRGYRSSSDAIAGDSTDPRVPGSPHSAARPGPPKG